MLSLTDALRDENSHDGNLLVEWDFSQVGMLTKHKVDHSQKDAFYDLSNEFNHEHN